MFRRFNFDFYLLAAVLILMFVGIGEIYNTSGIIAEELHGDSQYFLIRHSIYAGIGAILMIIIGTTPLKFLFKKSFAYIFYFVGGLFLYAVLRGPIINGTQRWLRFGSFSVQPSEFAKLIIILFLASYLSSTKREVEEGNKYALFYPVFAVGIYAFLIIKEPDFGTALLIVGISIIMLFLSGISIKLLSVVSLSLFSAGAIMALFHSYVIERIKLLMDYTKDPLGSGFQIIQSLIAIGSGGISGNGFWNSTQKYFFLPYAQSDFIFSIIAEEGGFAASIIILILYFVILVRGIGIARRMEDFQKYLIASGITFWIVIQALINIAVVTGIFIPKGIPLPFVSYGGSSLLSSFIGVGILLNLSNRGLR